MRKTAVVGALVALSLALGGAAWAQSKCDARVTTALARKVRCKLKTFAAAQEAGSAVNTSRLSGCEATFARKCGKAQAKGGCQAQASSCPELEATADAAVDVLRGTPTQTASKCDGAVTRAVGKKVGCKLRVHAAAQEAGGAVNPAKLTKCEGNFTAGCGKAQSKGDCQAQTSSCAALEATADAAIDVLSGGTTSTTILPTTTTSSTTTTTSTTTSTTASSTTTTSTSTSSTSTSSTTSTTTTTTSTSTTTTLIGTLIVSDCICDWREPDFTQCGRDSHGLPDRCVLDTSTVCNSVFDECSNDCMGETPPAQCSSQATAMVIIACDSVGACTP